MAAIGGVKGCRSALISVGMKRPAWAALPRGLDAAARAWSGALFAVSDGCRAA